MAELGEDNCPLSSFDDENDNMHSLTDEENKHDQKYWMKIHLLNKMKQMQELNYHHMYMHLQLNLHHRKRNLY